MALMFCTPPATIVLHAAGDDQGAAHDRLAAKWTDGAGVGGQGATPVEARADAYRGTVIVEPLDAARGVESGVLATGQILGAGQAVLDMATAYAKQRVQFA
jgi:hypothetical protein